MKTAIKIVVFYFIKILKKEGKKMNEKELKELGFELEDK